MPSSDGEGVAYQLGHLKASVEGLGERIDHLVDGLANHHQELLYVRAKLDAMSGLDRKPGTKTRATDRKPWEKPIGELAADIGISALKVVGVAAAVAMLMWAVQHAKLP